jgi:diaminopropionate ammonia-lyase family
MYTVVQRPVFLNTTGDPLPESTTSQVFTFHKSFPGYEPTQLVPIPSIAKDHNLKNVFIKVECPRFSLPSFKILGASYGIFKLLTKTFSLNPEISSIDELKTELRLKGAKPVLVAATDGNHGRAVAYMAGLLELDARIYVPRGLHERTIELIKEEGADVRRVDGSYDDAVNEAEAARTGEGLILVQDMGFEGYEEIPQVSLVIQEKRIEILMLPVDCGRIFDHVHRDR